MFEKRLCKTTVDYSKGKLAISSPIQLHTISKRYGQNLTYKMNRESSKCSKCEQKAVPCFVSHRHCLRLAQQLRRTEPHANLIHRIKPTALHPSHKDDDDKGPLYYSAIPTFPSKIHFTLSDKIKLHRGHKMQKQLIMTYY